MINTKWNGYGMPGAETGITSLNIAEAEKRQILERLLAEYNDGRKKMLFCLAVNLLPLEDLRAVFSDDDLQLPIKERANRIEKKLKEKSSIELRLRRK